MLYNNLLTIIRPLAKLLFRVRVENQIQLPEGPVVVVANHKNNLDPVMVSLFVDRQVHWMAKKELFKYSFFSYILKKLGVFPVDRQNNDLKSMRQAMSILKDQKVLGVFPEGTRMKKIDYKAAKSGTIMLASRMGAKILPVYIEGDYRLFRPLTIRYRSIIELDKQKKTEEEYKTTMENIMKIIYEGDKSIGNNSK